MIAAKTRQWLPVMLVGAVSAGCLYALLLREPGGQAGRTTPTLYECSRLYVTRGAGARTRRLHPRRLAVVLAGACPDSHCDDLFFFLLQGPHHSRAFLADAAVRRPHPAGHAHVRSSRRFAPFCIVTEPYCVEAWSRPARSIGVVVTLLIAREYVSASQPLRSHVEYAGLIPRLERLAERSVTMTSFWSRHARHPMFMRWRSRLPTSTRETCSSFTSRPDKPAVVRLVNWALQRYKKCISWPVEGQICSHPVWVRASSKANVFRFLNTRKRLTTSIRGDGAQTVRLHDL